MKATDVYLHAKREILDIIDIRIAVLEFESSDDAETEEYFKIKERIDELDFIRSKIRNILLANKEWNNEN